jgi:hypothetical protein
MAALKVCMLLFTAFFFAGHIELSAALKVRGVWGDMREGRRSGDRVFAHVRGAPALFDTLCVHSCLRWMASWMV